jgi:hypothetical protein
MTARLPPAVSRSPSKKALTRCTGFPFVAVRGARPCELVMPDLPIWRAINNAYVNITDVRGRRWAVGMKARSSFCKKYCVSEFSCRSEADNLTGTRRL